MYVDESLPLAADYTETQLLVHPDHWENSASVQNLLAHASSEAPALPEEPGKTVAVEQAKAGESGCVGSATENDKVGLCYPPFFTHKGNL